MEPLKHCNCVYTYILYPPIAGTTHTVDQDFFVFTPYFQHTGNIIFGKLRVGVRGWKPWETKQCRVYCRVLGEIDWSVYMWLIVVICVYITSIDNWHNVYMIWRTNWLKFHAFSVEFAVRHGEMLHHELAGSWYSRCSSTCQGFIRIHWKPWNFIRKPLNFNI